jgi:hypothetical protein
MKLGQQHGYAHAVQFGSHLPPVPRRRVRGKAAVPRICVFERLCITHQLLGFKREKHIEERRGKAEHCSHCMKLRPMLEQRTRLCRSEIAIRCE